MLKLRNPVVIVGLGKTGMACLRFLTSQDIEVTVVDSRINPPMLKQAQAEFPEIEISCGSFENELISTAATLVVSPGISIHQAVFQEAVKHGAEIIGDIEIFARTVTAPVIAITGSNGKTTVTHLLGELIKSVNINVAVGGNIGTPCLELGFEKNIDCYVLELSSFQLETTHTLEPVAAAVLNISPDHLDRYEDMDDYLKTKLNIFSENTIAVIPLHQDWKIPTVKNIKTFSLCGNADYSIVEKNQQKWVSVAGEPWMAICELQLFGKHNQLNILAALALLESAGVSLSGDNKTTLIRTLKNYRGLAHRCEVVAKKRGVLWVNDSKATNVASAKAAVDSFAENFSGQIVLIAGGDSKNADLSSLKPSLIEHVFALITFGQDGGKIAQLAEGAVQLIDVKSLQSAVEQANIIVPKNGVVLLAPACSSLDMFVDYEARGQCFIDAVEALAA